MHRERVQVLSIHDHKESVLAFDLKDVLKALNGRFAECVWCITVLDCFGSEICEEACRAVENSDGGIWMSWHELQLLAAQSIQTIEGEFLAFRREIGRASITERDLNLGEFPTSKAELAILAVDSSFFEVYAKDPEVLVALRRSFQDVRLEDPSPYFFAD
jgi:hypothetical protein